MDTRRLRAFTKIVDLGSISRAAGLLNIAQPALSQQLAALEATFKQRLVIRSKAGVTPTAAGLELYRHAQTILKQLEQAKLEVGRSGGPLTGRVSVALAPYSAGSTIAIALLSQVRQNLPGVSLHLTESFGEIYSEMVISGRLDIAVIHGSSPIKGVNLEPIMREDFFLLAPKSIPIPVNADGRVSLSDIATLPLLLPQKHNFVRKQIDTAFARLQMTPNIVAEIESLITLKEAISSDLGCTILPWSVAARIHSADGAKIFALSRPMIQEDVSLCTSALVPPTEASSAVRSILINLGREMAASQRSPLWAVAS